MIGMHNNNVMIEQQVDINPEQDNMQMQQPLEINVGQNSQPTMDEIMKSMQEQQEKMIDQVQMSQNQFRQKIEDALVKGLEGITTIRYGEQAKEYRNETQNELDRMRAEMQGEMDHLIDMIHTTQKSSTESTARGMQKLSDTMGELGNMIKTQQEGLSSAIQGMSKIIADSIASLNQTCTNAATSRTTLVGGDNLQNQVPNETVRPFKSCKSTFASSNFLSINSLNSKSSESEYLVFAIFSIYFLLNPWLNRFQRSFLW